MTAKLTAFDAFLAAGAAVLVFQLLGPALTIPLHVPLNYNEGWNAIFDTRAVHPAAGPLYPPPDSFVFNNYPPLGFYIVGALGLALGDMIEAGRTVALVCLLATGVLTGLCVVYLGGHRRPALAAALLIPLVVCCYFRKYVAVDDPQWLAQALMLSGLSVLLRHRATEPLRTVGHPAAGVVAAALLMIAGGMVKHNLVALPIATTLWLICLDRRAAATWVTASLLFAAIGVGAIAVAHGNAAADILHHRRVFRPGLMKYSVEALAPLLPMTIVAGVLLRLASSRDVEGRAGALFVALFGGTALVTGVVQRMGEGVYYNAHFETVIAACLGFGLALSPLFEPASMRRRPLAPAALTCLAAVPLICAWPIHLPQDWADIRDRSARAAAWQPLIARIASTDGPAGCVMISLCWWAGKPSEVDMFNLTQAAEVAGAAPPAFRAAVARRRFAIFEDDPTSFTHRDAINRLGYDPIMSLIARSYAPIFAGPASTVLLSPRAPREAGVAP